MAVHPVTGFGETRDLLGFMILFLPDKFPPHSERTLENCFEHFLGGLDSIAAESRKPEAVELISKIKKTSQESYALYMQSDIKEGCLRLQDADDLLEEVGRILHAKKPKQS